MWKVKEILNEWYRYYTSNNNNNMWYKNKYNILSYQYHFICLKVDIFAAEASDLHFGWKQFVNDVIFWTREINKKAQYTLYNEFSLWIF